MPARPEAPAEYFEQLAALPAGTAASLQCKGRKLKDFLLGSKYVYDGPRIGVQVENASSGGLTYWIPLKGSLSIELSASQISKLPKRQKGERAVWWETRPNVTLTSLGAVSWH